jgi:hypothetical protein
MPEHPGIQGIRMMFDYALDSALLLNDGKSRLH